MPNCPVCGTEIPDTALFCRSCGHTLSTPIAVDALTSMKNSSPADEQPVEVSTVPTRSLTNNNEKEKEQAQASQPSGSTSSGELPIASSQYPEKEDKGELPDHAIMSDISTTDLSLENGNGMLSVKDVLMVQEIPHGNEVPASTLSDPSPKEDISQDEASPVASPPASPIPAVQTPMTPQSPAAKRGMSPAAKWLIIGIIALVLIAGGVGGLLIFLLPRAPATGGTPSAVTSPSSITTPAASVVATRAGSSISAISNGTVNLTFSGAVIGQMTGTNVLTCGSDQSVAGGTQYHVAVLGTLNGQQYALTFGVYPYTRPDTYTSSAFSFFGPSGSNNSVAQWRSSPDLGVSVTINSDGKSGSLEIGYISSSAASTAHISGSWKCA
jgi:hypothetical protein